jgi:hypothetical protein
MGINWRDGYSANLQIALIVDGVRYRVGKLGPGSMVLDDTAQISPGTAGTLVVSVDGRSTDEEVILIYGATAGRQEPVPFF